MINKDDIIKKYGKPDPNKKNNYINYDVIDSLPDGWEISISEFKFDPNKIDEYFTNLGSYKKPSWYPKTETMYKIGDMIGAEGTKYTMTDWITEEVDINPILMKPIAAEPTMRKMIVAARVTKISKVRCEDGNFRQSTPESNEFNFFDRACLEFLNEEEVTDSYKKHEKYRDSGKDIPFKFNTPVKRQKRLVELKKFAVQQAGTKATCKTIRVLAGIPTGFETKDLQDGKLVFMKYIKSKKVQKLELAAHLDAIRQGNTGNIENATSDLFGTNQIEAPTNDELERNVTDTDDWNTEPESEPEKTPDPELTEARKLKNVISDYLDEEKGNYKILEKKQGALDALTKAVKNDLGDTIDSRNLLKDLITRIEKIKGIKKIEHNLDLSPETEPEPEPEKEYEDELF
jgi:predicted SnoaL-like aldol condensation-catalyzing enzyme